MASALLALGLIAAPVLAETKPEADTVYVNGNVIPMTGPDIKETALAVKDGKILAVGSDAEIEALKGARTKRVDLGGKTMLPGFIDAHGHIAMVAQRADLATLDPPPVGGVSNIAELQSAMRAHAKAYPEGWIVGFGYDDAQMAERRHPTRQELDAISADRPIIAFHVSAHLAALNTKALELTGLLHPGADVPENLVRREAGKSTASGVIEEGAMFKAYAMLPKPSSDKVVEAMKAAQLLYARNGLTTAQDAATSPASWAMLQSLAASSELFIDVHALPLVVAPFPGLEKLPFNSPYNQHLRVGGIKIILDGSPQGRTAWLSHPYTHAPEGRSADYAGYQQVTDPALKEMLRNAAANGWQVFAHVNGDAAIQQLIDNVRAVNAEGGPQLKRTIAIHSQTARRDQLEAMKQLDIEPTFFASHTFFWGDWHREVTLGPVRADHISPQRDAIDLGLRPTIHNDSPVVPPDMMRLVWSAVTRLTRSDDILGPAERVTPYEALSEITTNAAYELHEEASKGTLEKGKLADLVILDGDPLTVPPANLLNLRVVTTIKEGKPVFGE